MKVGIESMNAYAGQTYIDISELFDARQLNKDRFSNLLMGQKSLNLPCEDPVTNAVNAAKPLINNLTEEERNRIEMVIACSESGLDFGKSMSTYIHQYLGLNRNCRLFEIKQACYAGTAALQLGMGYIASNASPGAKILVITSDVARAAVKMTYAEPSQGMASIAMLVSDKPHIFAADLGMNGMYSFEVMDTFRPQAEIETGDPDLSLLVYMECLAKSFQNYCARKKDVDFQNSFDFLGFHTPFGGLVKSAHRKMMRDLKKMNPIQIEEDFHQRVMPSLSYCMRVGNAYSGGLYLALAGIIDTAEYNSEKHLGLFSYGSGCSSEFFSGSITPESKECLSKMQIKVALDNRAKLTIERYDEVLNINSHFLFGIKDIKVNFSEFSDLYEKQFADKKLLTLKEIKNYHREYDWS